MRANMHQTNTDECCAKGASLANVRGIRGSWKPPMAITTWRAR